MNRSLFTPEHDMFRQAVRRFVEKEVLPYHKEWEAAGMVSRTTFGARLAKLAFCAWQCPNNMAAWGKPITATTSSSRKNSPASMPPVLVFPCTQTSSPLTYSTMPTEEQKQRWLPNMVTGETITAIAMTEPDAGSDLAGMRTTAVLQGRPLHPQRSKNLHHQWHPQRPRHRRCQNRSRRPAPGPHPAGSRARHGWLQSWAQPGENGLARPGHGRTFL